MSKFKQVIVDHRAAELAAAEAMRLEHLRAEEARRKFTSEFAEVVSSIVRPTFQQFAAELREEGLRADVEELSDEKGNPAVAVRFTCDPSGDDECTFRLSGDVALSMAQRLTRIGRDDQGSGGSHTPQSITPVLLNQKLSEALKRGLKQFASAQPST